MFKQYNPMQYLAIDIANHFGLDKLNFEDRIKWVKDNLDSLEDFQDQAEEPMLYYKAVNALRKVQAGKPIGHTVALDSASSGLQIMSAVMRCKKGASLTGIIDPDNRTDAYTLITERMKKKLRVKKSVTRKQAKQAIMTYLYGSEKVPEETFPNPRHLNCFYETVEEMCSGANELLQILLNSHNPDATEYSWYMPDGHYIYCPVMVSKDIRVELPDWNYRPVARVTLNEPTEYDKSNAANAIHSIDAYILRSLVRRCNYEPKLVKDCLISLETNTDLQVNDSLAIVKRFNLTQMPDIAHLQEIKDNASYLPKVLKDKLINILKDMLKHEPFDMITIHDSFACHPNHCNQLRYHYKEILADLSDSIVIDDILSQLYGERGTVDKGESISDYIRNSNYAIS